MLDTSDLKSVIHQFSPVEAVAWKEFEQFFFERRLAKQEMLWEEGEFCQHLVFIQSGLIRCYDLDKGVERTHDFYLEGSLFYDDYSFHAQRPSLNFYQAIEATVLIAIPRAALHLMYDKYKSFERLGRIAVESNHIRRIESVQRITRLSAEENYRYLLEHQPELVRRAPLKMIASYLHISPEHLSRIRRGILPSSHS